MTDHDIPAPGFPIADLARRLTGHRRRRARRRDTVRLLDLDDHILNDIGFTRDDVRSAMRAPLFRDAPTELRRMTAARRRA